MAAASTSRPAMSASGLPNFGARYEVLDVLGKGGMGAVYKARDLELDRLVALKLLRPELVPDAAAIQRFKQELLLASKISHRNILRIHDLGDFNGVKFISMAYIEGQDLHRLICEQKRLPLERALSFARQILHALDAAHAEGVVHRDLKPQNIMIGARDHLYVMDFGLAKSAEADLHMTLTGQVVGTPQYMAPEQVEGGPIDHRADLYAFGLILDEMLTGDLVFKAESAFHLMLKRIREAPRSPRELIPDIPDYVERIVMRCLMRSPDERYQSAREILNDLDAQAAQVVKQQATLVLSQAGAAPALKKRRAGIAVMSVFLVLAIGAASLLVPGVRRTVSSSLGMSAPMRHVAVLPLTIAGDNEGFGYIASGITEALTAELGDLNSLQVASPNAVQNTMQRLGAKATPAQAAASLGVDYLVGGTLTTGSEDRFNVMLQLYGKNGEVLASPRKDGVKRDLLSVEQALFSALRAAPSLASKASSAELARAASHLSQNTTAEDLYLQGRNLLLSGQLDQNKMHDALDRFEQARSADPAFALAYTGIADAALRLYNETKDSQWAARAQAAAQQARLNNKDDLPEVYLSLGSVDIATANRNAAISELKRAVELAPNSDEGYRRLGDAYRGASDEVCGKPGCAKENAIAAYSKAISVNPYYWWNFNVLGTAYWKWGDSQKAIEQFDKVTQLDPNNAAAYQNLGAAYFSLGRMDECIRALETSLRLDSNNKKTISNLGTAYFYQKRYGDAVRMFEKAVQLNPNYELGMGNLADAYRWSGRTNDAKATYDKAIALALNQLQVNPKDGEMAARLATYFAKKGDTTQAENWISKAEKIDSANKDLLYYKAQIAAISGNNSTAIDALKGAFSKGYSVSDALNDPEFGKLQADPQFTALVNQYKAKT